MHLPEQLYGWFSAAVEFCSQRLQSLKALFTSAPATGETLLHQAAATKSSLAGLARIALESFFRVLLEHFFGGGLGF
ncbi:hypothetical protein QO010_000710 [Caulobacter ginsengisoli]|uniref:Uncharacterized protein n=1 Tax=Caulobacter ginsengisoli TaxID=400775 RepID=A0ABU0IPS2_9CAUL|nr:hypothetical protein [Caulobacter ginsengisoli]MDQ0462962.1 hypothetical protein [Caulobacter ginsengisoli]